jgi:hypothetical protein
MTSVRKKRIPIVFWIALVVLIGGVGISVGMKHRQSGAAPYAHLLSTLPTAPAGWEVKDMPIATSVEMQKAVNEMLNYDEAVYREYRKGGRSLTVYAAYWRPYRFHPRLISIHTPDVCWVGNGWVMKHSNYNFPVRMRAHMAWHAQERLFDAGGVRMNVLYWHLLDGKLSGYAEGPNSVNRSFVQTVLYDLKHGAGEQFFIRLSSEQPWSVWMDDPLFLDILETFSPVLKAAE